MRPKLRPVALGCVLGAMVLPAHWGCQTKVRPKVTDADLIDQRDRFMQDAIDETWDDGSRLIERLVRAQDEYAAGHRGDPPVVNILVLSGGGDYGAFAAGFLVGWGEVQDPAFRRPTFDVVTGVSTGALIAPFAFIGDDESFKRVFRL